MDKESTVQELTRSLVLPRTREDTFSITMEVTITMEGVRTIIGSNEQNRSNPSTPAKRDLSHITCFKRQKTGHYATECPEAKNGNGNGSFGKKPNPFNRGQVNHVNVDEVEDQPDAVIGKFLVKSFTATVLFDTGASHSYISRDS